MEMNSWSLNVSGHLKAHDFKLSIDLRPLDGLVLVNENRISSSNYIKLKIKF